jgi:hypothetical protein
LNEVHAHHAATHMSRCHSDAIGDILNKIIRNVVDWDSSPKLQQVIARRQILTYDKGVIAIRDRGRDRAADVQSLVLVEVVSRRQLVGKGMGGLQTDVAHVGRPNSARQRSRAALGAALMPSGKSSVLM